jgi:formylmethanofuran dehydrogenase subunit B
MEDVISDRSEKRYESGMKLVNYPHAACTRCGCVCDDLTLAVAQNRIVSAEGACDLSRSWLLEQNSRLRTIAEISGVEVPLESAIRKAAELLKVAKAPLIYGLSHSTTDGQRAAIELGEKIGAIIDTTACLEHAQSLISLQQVGESTCSLGEVKNRADLIIYWGSDPLKTHPRHLERYSLPEGKPKRPMVVVDVKETETTKRADTYIQVQPGEDWEIFWQLRLLIAGKLVKARPELVELAEKMKACRFGVIFFGKGLTRTELGHRTVEALLRLVTELNRFTRFYARRMGALGDVAGADNVLAWQTGFPLAVNLQRGYPRYSPGEFSAVNLLAKKQVDICLIIGSDTLKDFPAEALATLRELPTIVLDAEEDEPPIPATVRFTTANYGIHHAGTAYRMDEIPIPLRPILKTTYPTDDSILRKLCESDYR